MAVEPHHEALKSDALRPGAAAWPSAEWFVVCDLNGGLVADLKLSNPPVIRGPIKALRAGLATVLEVLNSKNFLLHTEAGEPGSAGAINETKDKIATNMKTNLLTETDGQGSDNGGGAPTPPDETQSGQTTPAAAAEGTGETAAEGEAKGTPAEDNADATGKATA